MSLNRMILYSKLKNGLWKIVTKSQVVNKFNVTKSRLHCTFLFRLLSPAILSNSGAPDKETRPVGVETLVEADASTTVDDQ